MDATPGFNECTLVAGALRRPTLGPAKCSDDDPMVRAKMAELHSRTVSYNRELARIAKELADLRAAAVQLSVST